MNKKISLRLYSWTKKKYTQSKWRKIGARYKKTRKKRPNKLDGVARISRFQRAKRLWEISRACIAIGSSAKQRCIIHGMNYWWAARKIWTARSRYQRAAGTGARVSDKWRGLGAVARASGPSHYHPRRLVLMGALCFTDRFFSPRARCGISDRRCGLRGDKIKSEKVGGGAEYHLCGRDDGWLFLIVTIEEGWCINGDARAIGLPVVTTAKYDLIKNVSCAKIQCCFRLSLSRWNYFNFLLFY